MVLISCTSLLTCVLLLYAINSSWLFFVHLWHKCGRTTYGIGDFCCWLFTTVISFLLCSVQFFTLTTGGSNIHYIGIIVIRYHMCTQWNFCIKFRIHRAIERWAISFFHKLESLENQNVMHGFLSISSLGSRFWARYTGIWCCILFIWSHLSTVMAAREVPTWRKTQTGVENMKSETKFHQFACMLMWERRSTDRVQPMSTSANDYNWTKVLTQCGVLSIHLIFRIQKAHSRTMTQVTVTSQLLGYILLFCDGKYTSLNSCKECGMSPGQLIASRVDELSRALVFLRIGKRFQNEIFWSTAQFIQRLSVERMHSSRDVR